VHCTYGIVTSLIILQVMLRNYGAGLNWSKINPQSKHKTVSINRLNIF